MSRTPQPNAVKPALIDTAPQRHRTVIDHDADTELLLEVGGRRGWWFKVFHSWVDNGWWAYMDPAPAKVLIVLAKHANADGLCWPGVSLLCKETGLERASIYAALNQLEAFKILTRRARGNGRNNTVYQIHEATTHAAGKKPHGNARKPAPGSRQVQSGRPVHQIGQSGRLSELLDEQSNLQGSPSNLPESTPYRRNRSISQLKELEPCAAREGKQNQAAHNPAVGVDEMVAFVRDLEPQAADQAKAVILRREKDEDARAILNLCAPTSRSLAIRIHQLLNPA